MLMGFQESVIGLQALSEFNIRTRQPDLNLECTIKSSKKSFSPREIIITGAYVGVRKEIEVRFALKGVTKPKVIIRT